MLYIVLHLFIYNSFLFGHDGQISYDEFVVMMIKGTMGLGKCTMRSRLNGSMRDAPGALNVSMIILLTLLLKKNL